MAASLQWVSAPCRLAFFPHLDQSQRLPSPATLQGVRALRWLVFFPRPDRFSNTHPSTSTSTSSTHCRRATSCAQPYTGSHSASFFTPHPLLPAHVPCTDRCDLLSLLMATSVVLALTLLRYSCPRCAPHNTAKVRVCNACTTRQGALCLHGIGTRHLGAHARDKFPRFGRFKKVAAMTAQECRARVGH